MSLPNMLSYTDHMENLVQQIPNNSMIFEVTKCCNYSTFVLVHKNASLMDLYRQISLHFECQDIKSLYVIHSTTKEKIRIPLTEMVKLKAYVVRNRDLFIPIYPIPNYVVYRVYLDDGHVHVHDHIQTQIDVSNNSIDNNVFSSGL